MNLEEYLSSIHDFRRAQGLRFALPKILLMIILGIMNGYSAYRELASFIKGNAEEFS